MNSIIVVPDEDGKYKVLINYIQQGVSYSSEIQANKEAQELRKTLTPAKKVA
jgi:hypothetical protein